MAAPSEPPENRPPGVALPVLLALFVVSGAAGLVYEVAWTRALLLLLGSTATASAVVLAAFLGGLGVGAAFGGRIADRSRRPLALYGVLEIAAAAWAVLLPFLLALLERPYVSVASGLRPDVRIAARIAVAVVAVVPGAALVGATFPAILRARAGASRGALGTSAAWLYGANTVGAVAGALWAGFAGILAFGVSGASRVAAAAPPPPRGGGGAPRPRPPRPPPPSVSWPSSSASSAASAAWAAWTAWTAWTGPPNRSRCPPRSPARGSGRPAARSSRRPSAGS